MKRIGIYGGTFNPVHLGHERTAREFYEQKGLYELLIMPTNAPPHKKVYGGVSARKRYEMCVCAFGDSGAKINVSDAEIKKGGISYSYDLLITLRAEYSADEYEMLFLCGADMVMSIESWYKYEEFLSMCTLVVASRDGNVEENEKVDKKCEYYISRGYKMERLRNEALEMSSSEIRHLIKSGATDEKLLNYLSPSVLRFIREEKLYVD